MTGPTRLRLTATTRIGMLALLAVLLVLPLTLAPRAEAFIYWTNYADSIGRANLDGSGVDNSFITGAGEPVGVAIGDAHIYWTTYDTNTIGRANLDGSRVDKSFITDANNPFLTNAFGGMAVDAAHIYWTNSGVYTIVRANLDGSGVDQSFITGLGVVPSGVAVDAHHVYWTNPFDKTIGRANLDGSGVDKSFITDAGHPGGVAVDAAHVYWAGQASPDSYTIGRANLDGSGVDKSFITSGFFTPSASPGIHAEAAPVPFGVAVDAAHVYWTNNWGYDIYTIGRANLDGSGVDQSFITDARAPTWIAVNFSLGKLRKDKKKGTAKLTVDVPAPGEIALAQTKKVKAAELRAVVAGEVQLAIKPRGRAKKKLAQKGKAKVKVDITYTPDGGQPETQIATLKLIERG